MNTPCMTHADIQMGSVQAGSSALRSCATLALGLCLVWIGSYSPAMANPGYLGQRKIGASPEALYKRHCSVCHGDRGSGNSRASHNLVTPPRDFSTATNLTRKKMIFAVENGKATTAMMAWKSRFTEKEIEGIVDYIRGRFMLVALDPRIAQGRGVYGHFCQVCHGDRGQGIKSTEMAGVPRDLNSAQAQAGLTRERMIASISRGQHGPIKTGFGEKLSAEHIGAAVDYIRRVMVPDLSKSDPPYVVPDPQSASALPSASTPLPDVQQQVPATATKAVTKKDDMSLPLPKGLIGDMKLGEKFFMANCATCHGKKGDAQGPRAYFINPRPRNFHDDYSRNTLDRPTIFSSVSNGRPGTEMPSWDKVLTEQEIANVTEFVFRTFIQPNTGAKANAK